VIRRRYAGHELVQERQESRLLRLAVPARITPS
jgi:hypothetical protein